MPSNSKPMRAIIVDDEPLGCTVIREMLRADTEVEILTECQNGQAAIDAINKLQPDLVFLDVQMPEINGFDVLTALDQIPLVIFVTAYDEYAVQAFEVNALDYLLKPYDRERFAKALQRAKSAFEQAHDQSVNQRILALLESQKPTVPYLERLVIKTQGRVFFLKTDEIDWIEAEGNYVNLHVKQERHLLRETLSNLAAQLNPRQFARIHRSHLVNLDSIKELHPWSHGDYQVILHNGTELTLSRNYRESLQALLGNSF